ncbi:MAG: hydroxymethylbilane synthase [Thermoguttaceae bacterium]
MTNTRQLRLGTRASLLAQWQANWVTAQLRRCGLEIELIPITTSGDEQQTASGPIAGAGLGPMASTGIFTKEIQRELLAGRIDLAVHSLKDLPTEAVPGLALAAVPERASVADVLVSDRFDSLELLPPGAVVGTGSLRRRAQLLNHRDDLEMRDIRGNVDTRLRKLREGQYEAIILAQAGLDRLGLTKHITQILPLGLMLPAVGQGALGIETRADNSATREALACLDHPPTHFAVMAERTMLAALHGGCMAPIAAWGRIDGEQLILTGRVLDPAGSRRLEATHAGTADEAESLGRNVANALLQQGAADLIAECRG